MTWRLQGSLRHKPHCASVAGVDRLLDRCSSEPQLLAEERYARIVKREILRHDGALYDLHAWVVMHNHIHLLMTPLAGIPHIARTIMDRTEATAGTALWARESYERHVPGPEETAVARWIEQHPVRANLVPAAGDWEWSSAFPAGTATCTTTSVAHPRTEPRRKPRRAA